MDDKRYIIGFANMDEKNAFPIAVRAGLEKTALNYPEIELVLRNNDQDTEKAIANAQEFADIPVDLAILFHTDIRARYQLAAPLQGKKIPIISVDLPMPSSTFFGYNHKYAAEIGGEVLGKWVKQHWNGQVDKVLNLTASRLLGEIQHRFTTALKKLTEYAEVDPDDILYLESEIDRDATAERTRVVLEGWNDKKRIAVIALNDYVAMGVLDAARALKREQDIAVLSYDGTELALAEFRKPDSRLIVSVASYPERYGEGLIRLALQILRGGFVLPQHFIECACITNENYQTFLV